MQTSVSQKTNVRLSAPIKFLRLHLLLSDIHIYIMECNASPFAMKKIFLLMCTL